jgi:hypothetical protein
MTSAIAVSGEVKPPRSDTPAVSIALVRMRDLANATRGCRSVKSVKPDDVLMLDAVTLVQVDIV